jgi:hypothetical protein
MRSEERLREEYADEASSVFFNGRPPENDPEEEAPFRMDGVPADDPFDEHTVAEIMTRAICSLPADAEIGEAAQYMWQAGIHRVLVLEDGHLAGILSMSDIARLAATT